MSKNRISIGVAVAIVAVSVLVLSRRRSARQKLADATSRLWAATLLRGAEAVSKVQSSASVK